MTLAYNYFMNANNFFLKSSIIPKILVENNYLHM